MSPNLCVLDAEFLGAFFTSDSSLRFFPLRLCVRLLRQTVHYSRNPIFDQLDIEVNQERLQFALQLHSQSWEFILTQRRRVAKERKEVREAKPRDDPQGAMAQRNTLKTPEAATAAAACLQRTNLLRHAADDARSAGALCIAQNAPDARVGRQ